MASGDIYRSRGRDGDPAGWQAAFYKGVRTGNTGGVDWLLGVTPMAGSVSTASRVPDPGQEFAWHRQALLQLLRSGPGILPYQRFPAWIASVEALDMGRPEAGLADLQAIACEYQQAISRWEASYSELTRPVSPGEAVEGVAREINRLGLLLYFAQVPRWAGG